jgi:GntR family transcriptional regulator
MIDSHSRNEFMHPFQRLQADLARLIESTPSGAQLPSEPELAKQLGVSRATLREAMRAFEGQGLIRRRQGVGTFVMRHTHVIEAGLEQLESIETTASRIGLSVLMGDLVIIPVVADKELAEQLECEVGTPLVEVSRVIYTDERPVAYLVDILPQDVLTETELKEGFTGSVLDLLLKRGSPELTTSRTEIRATAATPKVARSLQIQRGDTLLNFHATLYDINDKVVAYSISYFLPGYFRFQINRRVGK